MNKFLLLLYLILIALSPISHADSAQIQVTLTIEKYLRLSGIDNIHMAWDEGRNAFYGKDQLCTRQLGYEQYSLTISSANGAGNGYTLMQGDSHVAYSVRWNHKPVHDGRRAVQAVTAALRDCGENGNTTLEVMASQRQVEAASRDGMHADTLTIMVTPE